MVRWLSCSFFGMWDLPGNWDFICVLLHWQADSLLPDHQARPGLLFMKQQGSLLPELFDVEGGHETQGKP